MSLTPHPVVVEEGVILLCQLGWSSAVSIVSLGLSGPCSANLLDSVTFSLLFSIYVSLRLFMTLSSEVLEGNESKWVDSDHHLFQQQLHFNQEISFFFFL